MKNFTLTITGPSAVGKTYLRRHLRDAFKMEEMEVYTTRAARDDDSGDRICISREEFKKKFERGELLMVNEIFGNMYAFDKKKIYDSVSGDGRYIMELSIDNVSHFKGLHPSSRSIALLTDDTALLESRLKGRCCSDFAVRMESAMIDMKRIQDQKHLFDMMYNVRHENQEALLADVERYVRKEAGEKFVY
jgi:guanylate kinase